MSRIRKDEKGFTGLEAAIVLIAFVVVAAVFSYVMLGAGFFTTQKSKQVVDTGVKQASSSLTLDGQYIYLDCSENAGGDTGSQGTVGDIYFFVTQTAGATPVDLEKTSIAITTATGYKQLFFDQLVDEGDSVYVISESKNSGDVIDVTSLTRGSVTSVSGEIQVGSSVNITVDGTPYTGTVEKIVLVYLKKNTSYVPAVGVVVNSTTIVAGKGWWYESVIGDNDNVVEQNEKYKLILAVNVNTTAWNDIWNTTPPWYGIGEMKPGDTITIEVRPPIGAPLTITKQLPASFQTLTYV